MNIVIVNGGKDTSDPTTKALEIIDKTLEELNVNITKIDLYDTKNAYGKLQSSLQNSDAFVLGVTVEWIGIGSNMQRFLDDCWRLKTATTFKDKNALAVVLSKNGEEEDALQIIKKSFQMLGGNAPEQLCGMIKDGDDIISNPTYINIIEKKTEDFFRMINQKRLYLPTKYNHIEIFQEKNFTINKIDINDIGSKTNIIKKEDTKKEEINIINYDEFLKKQENDILEITKLFKEKLTSTTHENYRNLKNSLTKNFVKEESKDLNVIYQFYIKSKENINMVIKINDGSLSVDEGVDEQPDLTINIDQEQIEEIITKRKSMQTAFLKGNITVKGSVILLHNFDKLFNCN